MANERTLEDNTELWRLRIRDNEKIMIEREQQERAVEYICMECGDILKITRKDEIECHRCGARVVVKRRTQRGYFIILLYNLHFLFVFSVYFYFILVFCLHIKKKSDMQNYFSKKKINKSKKKIKKK